jgi:RNA polymerase sigma factor (sigma-70 family)
MVQAKPSPILRHIRHLLGAGLGGVSDEELLDRFVARRDEDAIAELVRRHGPLVYGVCRRVLADTHAAEDVFQATFLVLVRKAASLDRRRPLGSWLYTVAYRLALTARADAARRRLRENQAARRRGEASGPEEASELCVALEEELQRLPERFRAPLVLCYLEGKTNEQAAQVLGCPRGSLARRLEEARDRLRDRLRCRGYVCTATAVASALAAAAPATATVPLPVLDATVRAALWFATEGASTAGVFSTEAVTLAKKVLHTMTIQKLKLTAALVLTASLLSGGSTLLVQAVLGAPAAGSLVADTFPARNEPPSQPAALPAGAAARLGTLQLRHGDTIHFLAFTPDGRGLFTAGKDQTIRLWDLAAGTEVRRFERPEQADKGMMMAQTPRGRFFLDVSREFRVALSPDGRLLAATRGRSAYVWGVADGTLRHTFRDDGADALPGFLGDLTFTADGKALVTVDGRHGVTFWDLGTGKKARQLAGPAEGDGAPGKPQRVGGSVALAPGGRYLAWEHYDVQSQSGTLKVRDLTTGKDVGEARLPVAGAKGLTFAPDGKTLAWASFGDGIFLWDCTADKEPRQIATEPAGRPKLTDLESLTFAPGGKTVAARRSDNTVQLWDVASGKLVRQIGKPPDPLDSGVRVVVKIAGGPASASPVELAFAPDGMTLATSLGGSAVRRFNTDTGAEIAAPAAGHAGEVTDLCLAADGKTLTTYARHDAAHVWDLATGRELRQIRLPADATHVARDAAGRHVAATSGGAVTLWDAATGQQVGKIDTGASGVTALAVSPDGKTVATRALRGREIYLWDWATGRRQQTLTGTAPADGGNAQQVIVATDIAGVLTSDLGFSPDGRYLAGAGPKRQLCLWDVASGSTVWETDLPGNQTVERFTFTAGGLGLAAVNRDGTVSLYETATGELRCRLGQPTARPGAPRALMMGGVPVMVSGLRGESTPVAVAGAPGGRFLATASVDPVIRLWDVVSGQEVGQLKGHQGGVVSLAFSADGERLLSGSVDTTALVWDVGTRLRAAESAEVAPGSKELEQLWADLGGSDSARAFAAQQRLARHPAEAARLVKEHLRPAAAAEPGRLAQLVANLDSRQFAARQQAVAELEALGDQARAALEKALAGDVSLEVRQRIEGLLGKVNGKPGGGLVRDLRAVETLELAGGAEARRELEVLAGGAPAARLTREARAALQRLDRRPADRP